MKNVKCNANALLSFHFRVPTSDKNACIFRVFSFFSAADIPSVGHVYLDLGGSLAAKPMSFGVLKSCVSSVVYLGKRCARRGGAGCWWSIEDGG